MLLAATGIVVRFKGLTAVDHVDFALSQGEIVGLIGPNGSGKTTLLNVISGVLQPTAGSLRLGERQWSRTDLREAARLGIRRTFQNIRLPADLTALETVEVAAAWLGEGDRREAAMAAFEELEPPAISATGSRRSSPMACSGGSRSRGRSSAGCSSCCSTSRPQVSITPSRGASWRRWSGSEIAAAAGSS